MAERQREDTPRHNRQAGAQPAPPNGAWRNLFGIINDPAAFQGLRSFIPVGDGDGHPPRPAQANRGRPGQAFPLGGHGCSRHFNEPKEWCPKCLEANEGQSAGVFFDNWNAKRQCKDCGREVGPEHDCDRGMSLAALIYDRQECEAKFKADEAKKQQRTRMGDGIGLGRGQIRHDLPVPIRTGEASAPRGKLQAGVATYTSAVPNLRETLSSSTNTSYSSSTSTLSTSALSTITLKPGSTLMGTNTSNPSTNTSSLSTITLTPGSALMSTNTSSLSNITLRPGSTSMSTNTSSLSTNTSNLSTR